ncbi:MAG: ATP-dependent helicase, partial [Psychroflexus sp.]|nr:ATP-dependent helicase [Psychroflexus sp.]
APKSQTDKVFKTFENFQHNGRSVNVEITKDKGKSRKKGNFKRKNNSKSKTHRKGRSNNRNKSIERRRNR